jgi:hypothetical protein
MASLPEKRGTTIHGGTPRGKTSDHPIPGISKLWRESLGDPAIRIAILDGPVDLRHPSLDGAQLESVPSLVSSVCDDGAACRHGTHITSLIFGQHHGPVKGLAPRCSGVIIPIFESDEDGPYFRPCSQLDLARAITQAVEFGAQIINISGGQFTPSGSAYPLLADTIRACAARGVLIVSATGNESCECLHVPAALSSVLAVGAMNAGGEPLEFSNWGGPYQIQGILAPGENVLGAEPGGRTARRSGTSYATAIVSGVAALILSALRKRGMKFDPYRVRSALLESALGCDFRAIQDCRRLLAGRLNIAGAMSILCEGNVIMSEITETQAVEPPSDRPEPQESSPVIPAPPEQSPAEVGISPSEVQPSDCGCQKCAAGAAPQLVFALGELGYDFSSEARMDSFVQRLKRPERKLAYDRNAIVGHLNDHLTDASSLEWTLSIHGTVIYSIRPTGPFAADTYRELKNALAKQEEYRLEDGEEVGRISVPGVIAGTTRLLSGQVVPVIIPELHGMFQWTTAELIKVLLKDKPELAKDATEAVKKKREEEDQKDKQLYLNFLNRVYYELRNLGVSSHDRAINFAGTNVHEMKAICKDVRDSKERMELDHIQAQPSAICRPGSDCWDILVSFFYPDRHVQAVRKVYRYTVDVSDVVPVTVGRMRHWYTR